MTGKKEILKFTNKIILLAGLVFILVLTYGYAYRLVQESFSDERIQYALVDGNVEQPGYYKITDFTTNFDLLEKAGLNDSSNINHINLIEAANPQKALEVGISKEKVKPKLPMEFSDPQIIFFMGNVSLKKDLKVREAKMNQMLVERDILFTRVDGKARIVFKNLSEIDVNINSRIRVDKLDFESSPSLAKFKLDKGQLWIKVPKETPGSNLMIVTPNAQIELRGKSAEAVISARPMETSIHCGAGRVYITRMAGRQRLLLKKEQIVVVRQGEDVLEPMKQKFTQKTVEENYGDLETSFRSFKKTQEEVSLLLTCGNFNQIFSLLPKKNKLILMDLPPNTYVGDYIDGVFRLDQALALSGAEITREVVQRIIGRPVQYVATVDFETISEFAFAVDGLMINVDPEAAMAMRTAPGLQRLRGKQILRFLDPSLVGTKSITEEGPNRARGGGRTVQRTRVVQTGDAHSIRERRQKQVLMAFLKQIKAGGVSNSSGLALHMLQRMHSNIPIKEGLKLFRVYSEKDHWSIMNISMPSIKHRVGPLVLVKPRYDRIHHYYN